MKVAFKIDGKRHSVDFRVSTSRHTDFIVMAKDSKNLDILNQLTVDGDRAVKEGIRQKLEFRLNVSMLIDYNYQGAGYGFNVDFYQLIKKLK
jgi:acetolactate synthase regulatory subunit